jgi:phosphate-selective porin OprO/OprP
MIALRSPRRWASLDEDDLMRVRYASLVSSFALLMSSQLAFAQTEEKGDSTYQTLIALIDEMVANKLITRAKADALIANAKAKAATASLPEETPAQLAGGIAAPQDAGRAVAASRPGMASDPGAKIAPAEVGNAQVAQGAGGVDIPADLNVDWSRGAPVFASKDGNFTFKPRGRILADISSTSGSDYDRRNITVSTLRQFRMGGVGTVGDHIFYQFEADFRRNSVEVVNTFLGYRAKFGKVNADVRAGNLITDRGIDIGTAATANPFITTNINTIALATQGGRAYLMGIAARAGQKNWHWSVAVHGDALDSDFTRNDHRMFLTRAHWNPILTDKAIVHVGGWAYSEHIPSATASVAVNQFISGALNNSVQVNAATLTGATGSRAFGLEFGGTYGPIYAFSEYGERHVKGGAGAAFGTAKFKTLSVNGGFWVTGEKPTYASTSGTYVAPNVLRPVAEGGSGAIELVARYERQDSSGAPLGGTGWAATAGVNWYLTNYFRLMIDGIHWETNNLTGSYLGLDSGNTIAARAEVAF